MFISDVIGMSCLYSGVADAASSCILGIEPESNCLMCSYDWLSGEVCFMVGAYSVQAGFRAHSVYWGALTPGMKRSGHAPPFTADVKKAGNCNPTAPYMFTAWCLMNPPCPSSFNIQQFCVLPTQCIYVFCVDLSTNSDYFPIHN
jgi:hypothetical protein